MTIANAAPGMAELLLFRVGGEFFALPLANAEEAVEGLGFELLPGMPAAMLGIAPHRGAMLAIYAAEPLFGVAALATDGVTLIVRARAGRVGVRVDDVEDVIALDLTQLRPVPGAGGADPVLRGVTTHGDELVAVCDADAIVRACRAGGA